MIRTIQADYVFPDRTPALVDRLNRGLVSDRYNITDPWTFAARVTEDLREASQDKHMYLDYAPQDYAAAVADERNGALTETGELAALHARQAARTHHGLADMSILPGNIRYLKITGFEWVDDQTGAAYDDAMRFLRGGDAVIVDLRGNGGGSHAAVRYLLSHFMDGDQLDMTFLQQGTAPEQSRTLDYLPAGRLKGKPLFVLIDSRVGSAAEAFAYDVQQFKLGTLIGEKTAGAANNNSFTPVAPGFMLSASFGRPVHPVSGGNWEGVGVQPDVPVDPVQALPTAEVVALKTLVTRTDADPGDLAEWAWALPIVEAQLHPVPVPQANLVPFAGQYGERKIAIESGKLVFSDRDGVAHRLAPLTNDGWFNVEGYDDQLRIRFIRDAMEMQWSDEPYPTTVPRNVEQ
ncbi:MAG: S41 family peptidase [Candidatus Andeanibacterium colombiense]|uniref:S41 family peptidase n=1 Tax=Candidatus Andeanibacterium colombiense TaxID=3121345 RepID=A0AAJ6BQR8_9SPHN|nr:MAG: S41 family peptidase [Sphingomonadaceae bacterium]